MRIIGLTGGIASGKSSVAALLTKLGAEVIDADLLARDAVAAGSEALAAIAAEFGPAVLQGDGTLDRPALARIIFADPLLRKRLEAITHPQIRALARSRLDELRRRGVPAAFYMAPLLIEVGGAAWVDEVWVVYVDESTQVERLMARDGVTREEALQRIRSQLPMDEKATYGKVVIDNRGSLAETAEQVRAAWNQAARHGKQEEESCV